VVSKVLIEVPDGIFNEVFSMNVLKNTKRWQNKKNVWKTLVTSSDVKASRPKFCPRTRPRPLAFVLGMSLNFLFWSHENECNDGTGNHCEFAMIIYESYLPCAIDINLFKFTVTALSNYLGGDEVYIGYLWTRKIVLGLKGLSSFNVTDYIYID